MRLHLRPEDLEKLIHIKIFLEKDCRYHHTHAALCQLIGANKHLLKHGFKQIFNMTPYEYLTYLRIEKSKEMLANTCYSIKRIAYGVGFTDSPGFIKMFKKNTGYSPLAWRKSNGCRNLNGDNPGLVN